LEIPGENTCRETFKIKLENQEEVVKKSENQEVKKIQWCKILKNNFLLYSNWTKFHSKQFCWPFRQKLSSKCYKYLSCLLSNWKSKIVKIKISQKTDFINITLFYFFLNELFFLILAFQVCDDYRPFFWSRCWEIGDIH
jgi:hypothetical protein